jgi:hypothetical protein
VKDVPGEQEIVLSRKFGNEEYVLAVKRSTGENVGTLTSSVLSTVSV